MTFEEDQARTAAWLGCTVGEMNAAHDPLHHALCRWLGVRSHSMADAAGEPFDLTTAQVEEAAVLHVQRLLHHHRIGVPA